MIYISVIFGYFRSEYLNWELVLPSGHMFGYVFDDHPTWDQCFPLGLCPDPSLGRLGDQKSTGGAHKVWCFFWWVPLAVPNFQRTAQNGKSPPKKNGPKSKQKIQRDVSARQLCESWLQNQITQKWPQQIIRSQEHLQTISSKLQNSESKNFKS